MQRKNPISLFGIALLGLVGCVMFAPAVQAQQVRAYVSVDSVRIGDRFSLTVVAEHTFVADPIFPETQAGAEFFGDLEVLAVQMAGSRLASEGVAGSRIDSLVYEVATFALDTAFVPSIPVFFVADADTTFYASFPIELPIISLVPEDADGIRDLAPIADFPINPWPWILGILALLGVIAGLYYLWKRRRDALPETVFTAPVPRISPIEEAIGRLRTLEKDADLQDVAQIKPFYVELTEILRVYMSRRLKINAMESTSHELMQDLNKMVQRRKITPEAAHLSKRVLHVSDLVKFADIQPAPEVGHQAFRETRKILDEVEEALRPVEAPPAETAPVSDGPPTQPAEESAHEHVDPV
ncbi:MAG: hypothetical protein AAF564_10040 [Bacteroidota bacterium]